MLQYSANMKEGTHVKPHPQCSHLNLMHKPTQRWFMDSNIKICYASNVEEKGKSNSSTRIYENA